MASPIDFGIEVLMLQRGRYLCPDTIALFGLPATAPYFCSDWVSFLFQSVAPESLARIGDLRGIFLAHLEVHIHAHKAEELNSWCSPTWPHIAAMRRMAYEHVAHGLLASPLEDQGDVSFHNLLIRVGRCMNMASHVRQYFETPGIGFLGQCISYGEELCSLCADHRQACSTACINEGRGVMSRYTPENMFCTPVPSPFFSGGAPPSCYSLFGTRPVHRHFEPPSVPSDPPLTLFKEAHFDPLVEGGHDDGQQPPPQPQQQLQAADDYPRGPSGEHALPAQGCIRPWARRQRQGENERAAPVFIRDEGGAGANHPAWHGGLDDPCCDWSDGPGDLGAIGEPVGAGGGRRGLRWSVVGSIADAGGGPAVAPESPVGAISHWAPQGDWCQGERQPGGTTRVGHRRRREEEGGGGGFPRHVAWRSA